jgi:catechol-2,3-dioxygenase
MTIRISKLGHVNLRVADEAASKRFYTEVLGFQVAEQDLDHGAQVKRAMNHVNQRSIYFDDPDGNGLEIYYELPIRAPALPRWARRRRPRAPGQCAGRTTPSLAVRGLATPGHASAD